MDQQHVPQTKPNGYEDDVISLIDLLAVLVRFRRLIVWGTLLATLIGGAYFYLISSTPASWDGTVGVLVNPVPPTWLSEMRIDVDGVIRTTLATDAAIWAMGAVERPSGNASYSSTWDGRSRTHTITVSGSDRQTVEAYLQAVRQAIGPTITAQFRPIFEAAAQVNQSTAENVRFAIAGAAAQAVQRANLSGDALSPSSILQYLQAEGSTTVTALSALEYQHATFTALSNDASSLVSVQPGQITAASGASLAVRVVVTMIAAFFLMVFVAFVLQYARTVRGDAEEMAKLRAAWRGE